MNRIVRGALFIGCVAALAAACAPVASGPLATTPPPGTVGASPTPTNATPLIVGIIVPFTESAIHSEFGVAQQRAADLYLQRHGGVLGGRPTKIVYEDESVVAALDTVKATQLVETEHADVLLGLLGTDGAYAVRNYADAHHVIFIATNASGNALTRTVASCDPSCLSPYVFRTSYSAWQLSEPLGAWAAGTGVKAFDVVSADDGFGTESAAAFIEGLQTAGGAATSTSAVQPGTDWSSVIDGITTQPTRNVFAAFAADEAVSFITAWDRAQLSGKGYRLFGPGPLGDAEVLANVGRAGVGVTTASFWSSSLDSPENRALTDLFAKTYQDETGNPSPANGYVVEMWDAMTALDLALQKTNGSLTPEGLIGALESAAFMSPRGQFAFDHGTHNVIEDIYIREARATTSGVSNVVIATVAGVADPGQ